MSNLYDKMNCAKLVKNIHRLEWAARTTDDPLWSKEHQRQRNYCIDLLQNRINIPEKIRKL